MNSTPRAFAALLKAIKPKGRLIQEPHPYFIHPTSQAAAPVNIRFFLQRLGRTGGVYFPLMGIVFGWPFAAQYLITKSGGP